MSKTYVPTEGIQNLGCCWAPYWTFKFHKREETPWLPKLVLASPEWRYTTEI